MPRVILYDNLKSAVLEREGDAVRFHPTLLALSGHYRFEPRACAPYRPNEKGRVERAIHDVRDNFFAAREFASVAELNVQAMAWCHEIALERKVPDQKHKSVGEAFAEDKALMIALAPDEFPVEECLEVSPPVPAESRPPHASTPDPAPPSCEPSPTTLAYSPEGSGRSLGTVS